MGCNKSKPVAIEDVQEDALQHHKMVAGNDTASIAFSEMQISNLRTAFDGMKQSHGSGKQAQANLSPADFGKLFSFGPGQCDALFRVFDVDNDGSVDLNEFISGFCFMCKGTVEEKAALMFSANDLDKNGELDRDEIGVLLRDMTTKLALLQTAREARRSAPSSTQDDAAVNEAALMVDAMFKRYDDDSDGVISKDEFCEFMRTDKMARRYCAQLEQVAHKVLYSGINNPQSQQFWQDVQSTGGWDKGCESRAPPNATIQQRRRGRHVNDTRGSRTATEIRSR